MSTDSACVPARLAWSSLTSGGGPVSTGPPPPQAASASAASGDRTTGRILTAPSSWAHLDGRRAAACGRGWRAAAAAEQPVVPQLTQQQLELMGGDLGLQQ